MLGPVLRSPAEREPLRGVPEDAPGEPPELRELQGRHPPLRRRVLRGSRGAALIGLGVGFQHVGEVVGVTKVFQTRVGEGGMPTELDGSVADRLRGTGENPWDEFGTTTGRPRRVGW